MHTLQLGGLTLNFNSDFSGDARLLVDCAPNGPFSWNQEHFEMWVNAADVLAWAKALVAEDVALNGR